MNCARQEREMEDLRTPHDITCGARYSPLRVKLRLNLYPKKDRALLELLKKEPATNGFKILLNGRYLS